MVSRGTIAWIPASASCAAIRSGVVEDGSSWRRTPESRRRCGIDGIARSADEVIGLVERAQRDDGYLNTFVQVLRGGRPYTDLLWGHELYCFGHLIQAAVALRGNVSPSLLATGTPEDVDLAVKHLVDNVFNKGGKLILDAAFGLPDETPVENVRALFAAARKYAG